LRNCITHNYKFDFSKYDKSLLPVSWKNKTITLSMKGKFIEDSFFSPIDAWELFHEVQLFVKKHLP